MLSQGTSSQMKARSGTVRRTGSRNASRQHARFLLEISDLLSKSPPETELPGELAGAAVAVFCDLCAVHLEDAEGRLLLRAVREKRRSREKSTSALTSVLDPRRGFVEEAMRAGQPLLFRRATGKDSVGESAQRLLLATRMHSIITVPIMLGSKSVGTLSFLEATSKHPFGP